MPSATFDFAGTIGRSAFPQAGPDWAEIAWATTPWEKSGVLIVGVSLDLYVVSALPAKEPSVIEAFVGNSRTPDQMTPRRRVVSIPPSIAAAPPRPSRLRSLLRRSVASAPPPACDRRADSLGLSIDVMYPPGFCFALPGANDVADPTHTASPGHIDCHVRGTPGLEFAGSVTLFYSIEAD